MERGADRRRLETGKRGAMNDRDMLLRQLRGPLVALGLGLLPFWLFLGLSDTVRIGDTSVGTSRLNVGGAIMAAIGITMATRMLRPGRHGHRRWWPRTAIAAIALMLCVVQLLHSLELFTLKDLREQAGFGMRPTATYVGLAQETRRTLEHEAATQDRSTLLGAIVTDLAHQRVNTARFRLVSADCPSAMKAPVPYMVPTFVPQPQFRVIADQENAVLSASEPPCEITRDGPELVRLADEAARLRDILDIRIAAYGRRFGAVPAQQ